MRVQITRDVIEDAANSDALDAMIAAFYAGRHVWDVDPADVSFVEGSAWAGDPGRAGERIRAIIGDMRKSYTAEIYRPVGTPLHSRRITITNVPTGKDQFLPNNGARYLRQPVLVVVENVESDGAFIHALIRCLNHHVLQSAHSTTERLWEVDHAGGSGEIPKRIREAHERDPSCAPRLFALTDSDAVVPGSESRQAGLVRECCQQYGVPFTILTKRSIENYLPLEALRNARAVTYQGFVELNDVQRDHYNMKKGFRTKNGPVVPPEQADLFKELSPATMTSLADGFGKDVWQLFDTLSPSNVTEVTLRGRWHSHAHELDDLLDAICRLI